MALITRKKNNRSEERAYEPTAANIDLLGGGENAFRESVDAGHRIDERAQRVFILFVVLIVLYCIAIIFPKDLLSPSILIQSNGNDSTFLNRFVQGWQDNVSAVLAAVTGQEIYGNVYVSVMMRYIAVPLAGMGLAVSGAVYQGAFRNALVSPSTLGVMTGGQFGMVLWVVIVSCMGLTPYYGASLQSVDSGRLIDYLNTSFGLSVSSFIGCFVVVGVVLLTSHASGPGKTSAIMMIITGQVVGGVFGVFGTLARYYYVTVDPYGPTAEILQNLTAASFYRSYTWLELIILVVPLALTFFAVRRLSQRMMVLSLDRTEQRSLGIDTDRMQFIVVGLCTLLTAVIISFCGAIGFVGFLVPHLARRLVGPNFKYLLPASMLLGGIFVLGAYFLIDVTLGADYTQLVGIFISIIGAALFLATALRGRGVQLGAFK